MRFNHLCNESGVSRRQAMAIGAGGVGFSLGAGLAPLPPVFGGMADAIAAAPGKILVVFEWFGGYDGLATVVPYGDDALYRHRPTLAYKERDTLALGDGHHGFQRSMVGMKRLWDEGKLAVVHGVGYEQPSFSHFSSISFWHTGAPNSGDPFGWVGRVADAVEPSGKANFLVNVATSQTLAVRADKHVPVVFIDPNTFARDFYYQQRPVLQNLDKDQVAVGDTHKYLLDITKSARDASALVGEAWRKYGRTRNPDLNLRDLDRVAAIIEHDFPARLYYVPLRGSLFDTHVNQQSPHDRQVQYNSDAVWGFYQEMKRIGKENDVAMFIHSEFGRRVPENTSLGTDHGAGNVAFVIGGGVKGGKQYGEKMSLTNLVLDDNLQYTTDFRRVYATLIEEFLGYKESEKVLQGVKYKTLGMWG
jgi:uncharacterized protein (DUF1501 family)